MAAITFCDDVGNFDLLHETPKRFVSTSHTEVKKLLDDRASLNTKRSTSTSYRVLHDYIIETDRDIDVKVCTKEELCDLLCSFYVEARNKVGAEYKVNSIQALKYGLQRYFKECRKFDIVNDSEFNEANNVFTAKLKQLKKIGQGSTSHKAEIEPEDLQLLYSQLSVNDPVSLQRKVWTDVMLYLIRRGRENLVDMTKETFKVFLDGTGKKYVSQVVDELDKNHQSGDHSIGEGRMYEIPDSPLCPVVSFTKYLSKLHPKAKSLWQRPRKEFSESDDIWYCNVRLGDKSIGNLMAKMSEEYKLSHRYTNHCLRTTSIGILDASGVQGRHIIRISGHKSENSLKSYSRTVTSSKKREIAAAIGSAVGAINEKENIEVGKNDIPVESNVTLMDTSNTYVADAESNVVLADTSNFDAPVVSFEQQITPELVNNSEIPHITNVSTSSHTNNITFSPSMQAMRNVYISNSVVNFYSK